MFLGNIEAICFKILNINVKKGTLINGQNSKKTNINICLDLDNSEDLKIMQTINPIMIAT